VIAFAAPVWLAALGALAVPLAIHLWSRRAGRAVRVGSIRLLSGMPPATRRAVRLRDPWLLALRLALLAALALSLADPYWAPRSPRGTTWALLSEEALADRTLIDSLRHAGAELRLLEDGGRQMADGREDGRWQMADGRVPNYWSLLSEADRLAPPGVRFVVVAPLVADRFRGTRPAITAPVTWREVRADAPRGAPPAAAPPRRVVILADAAHHEDARYFETAIHAAAQTTGPRADVTRGSPADAATLAPEADWIVWLAAAGAAPALPGTSAPVWSDANGAPLLSVARDGQALAFRLHARITPDRALAPEFVEAVAALWVGPIPRAVAVGPRITAAQAAPAVAAAPAHRGTPAGAVPLAGPLWVLATLALALDRWLALGRRQASA